MATKEYKLKDLLVIKNGKDYKNLLDGPVPVYGTGGVMTYVNDKLYSGESILLPRKGSLENITYVNGDFWTVDTMYWSIVNETIAYPKYLYLYLSLLDLSKKDSGSTLPSMTFDSYYSVPVKLPSKEKQKEIANFIFQIIGKIEKNNEIIKELESMSKTLYDYWFLQFEFPNKEGKPYRTSGGKMVWNEELKREIPKGWEVKNAYEIADIKTGKEDANHATKNGKYPFFTCANDVLRCDDYKFDGNVILIAGNGDFNVKHYNGKFNAYQRTYVITPHNDKYVGVFHLSCKQTVEKFIKGSNGSIVKFITLRDIQNIKILDCKNDKLLEPFNVFLEKIDLLKKENQELLSLRDFLLPLLMNGQVKFKDK